MRHPRRTPGAGRLRDLRPVLSAAAVAFALAPGLADARDVAITGTRMNGFGRILLQFDEPTKVDVKTSNSVLVIGFGSPTRIRTEKLATELSSAISVVRRDPDNTGLRLALASAVKVNVLQAGERVYIDLLPPGWTGLSPGLPLEVVAELAQRAQAAEAKLKANSAKRQDPPGILKLRLAVLPTLTRVVLEAPAGIEPQVTDDHGLKEIRFARPLRLEAGDAKPKLAPGIALFETEAEPEGFVVRLRAAPGYAPTVFREGETLVIDAAKPGSKPSFAELAAQKPPLPARAEPAPTEEPKPEPRPRSADLPTRPASPEGAPPPAETVEVAPATSAPSRRFLVRAVVEAGPDGPSILFPFRTPTAAAAYERGGGLTLLFDTADLIEPATLDEARFNRDTGAAANDSGLYVLRYAGAKPGPARLLPAGNGWRLSFGNAGGDMPPDALRIVRAVDGNGHGLVKVGIAGASKAHWIRDADNARLAVVTARGRVQAVPLPRSFVEVALAATLHGVVVEGRADDVTVALDGAGVTISREAGLSLSSVGRLRPDGTAGSTVSELVLGRQGWTGEGSGEVLDRYQALVTQAAEAPRSGRAEARFKVARFLVANGMNEEAASVLSVARNEDPVFARRRETAILSGVAAIRSGRVPAARAFLSHESVGDDLEAALWRGIGDAMEKRWGEAVAAFAKTSELVELYSDDLAGPIRLLVLKAATEAGDIPRAERELAAIDRLATGSISRDEHDLARARVDEAAGRLDAAMKGYARLVEEGDHKAAAEASGRWIALSLKAGGIDRDTAIRRLEALSVTWRGGDTEIGTISNLARLYGEAERWRDMFAMTKRANRYFPDHPLTRSLHDASAALLERLLLSQDRTRLTPVQALALFFEFRELAPIGRRGDEVVRRLADRLVELDLLDQAAELLQYQVDNRLSGVARATVAARLAAIRLMDGKPLPAISVLHATRLAEIPDEVRRFRFMLEARAQSDLGRSALALETLEGETGPDFDRLRASVLWAGRRWREAGEAGEALLGMRWSGQDPLTDAERRDVIRAVLAYNLAEERVSLDRIRQKFAAKMMDSPDAMTFERLMRPGAIQSKEFRTAVQEAARADSFGTLLSRWGGREAEPAAESEPAGSDAGADKHADGSSGSAG